MATNEKAKMNYSTELVVKDKSGKVKHKKLVEVRHGKRSEQDFVKDYKEVM